MGQAAGAAGPTCKRTVFGVTLMLCLLAPGQMTVTCDISGTLDTRLHAAGAHFIESTSYLAVHYLEILLA